MSPRLKSILLALLGVAVAVPARGADLKVSSEATTGACPLFAHDRSAAIYADPTDLQPTGIAANLLADDVARVTGQRPVVVGDVARLGPAAVLVGTLGHSRAIDGLVAAGKLNVADLRDQPEAYRLQVVDHPLPGVDSALVIVGGGRRGTAYGVTTLSARIGVSPWYWWANVPVHHQEALYVQADGYTDGPPAVRYRGIFLNDEAPALTGWAKERFGGLNAKMYSHVFELLLRLRANYLWPAMWGNAFNEDDPANPALANDYGIVMGTSHQEPMMRAQKEFDKRFKPAEWNYATHPELMERFWREGIKRNKNYDSLITIGMRGRNDTEMIEGATVQQSVELTERIVASQRKIIADEVNPDVTRVPQVWCLYKEVQSYYEHGLRVPGDVTLLWSDDNWGNLRRLPTVEERKRPGGAGVYYHFDYVGDPRNYKWINTNQIAKVWEQMSLAHAYGADRIWVVNVGDLKPMELPISFFMDMAWDPAAMTVERMQGYTRHWAAQQFGDAHAAEIADLLAWYTRMNGRRKPELLNDLPYSVTNYHEADGVYAYCIARSAQAIALAADMPAAARDSFFELVEHPVVATAIVNEMYIQVARNRIDAKRRLASANTAADEVERLFKAEAALSERYNHGIAGGFWNHMMDQVHIGYTDWNDPKTSEMPKVERVPAGSATALAQDPKAGTSAKSPDAQQPDLNGFVEVDGCVAMQAAHYSRKVDADRARWVVVEDLGLTGSAATIAPPTAVSVLPTGASSAGPCLEYRLQLADAGKVTVTAIVSPTQAFVPGRGLRYAIGFDDEPLQVVDTIADRSHLAWQDSVKDGARRCASSHTLATAGDHTLKVYMVDPAVVLQKLIVDFGGVRPSYLGPPESPHRTTN